MKYILTDDEKTNYHVNDVRATVRDRALENLRPGESCSIVDDLGEAWDYVSKSSDTEPPPMREYDDIHWKSGELDESPPTPTDLELSEAERVESRIKPLVIGKIRSEVRAEYRAANREQMNEILKLRAENMKLKQLDESRYRQVMTENMKLRTEVLTLRTELKNIKKTVTEEVGES
jgi:hypothetical protein